MNKIKNNLYNIGFVFYYLILVGYTIWSFLNWEFIGLIILSIIFFVNWTIGVFRRSQFKISELEFDNKQTKKRIYDLEDGFSNLSNIILKDQSIYWTPTPEQKESQRRSFVYGTTKLSNPEITKDLVNEIAESNKNSKDSKRTLFDDLWKIEPPVKK